MTVRAEESKNGVGFLKDHAQFPRHCICNNGFVWPFREFRGSPEIPLIPLKLSRPLHSTPHCLLADPKWSVTTSVPPSLEATRSLKEEGESETEKRMATATAEFASFLAQQEVQCNPVYKET